MVAGGAGGVGCRHGGPDRGFDARAVALIAHLRAVELDAMTERGSGRLERPGRQFQHSGGAAARQPDAPGLQLRDPIDDHALLVERDARRW